MVIKCKQIINLLFDFFTVVNQFYEAEIMTEYVIRGNTALLKCSIPSFVADFVQVESWVDNAGQIYVTSTNYGNHSFYQIYILFSSQY